MFILRKAAAKLGKKYQVSLPIIEEVNKVLFEDKSPKEAVNELMLRVGKAEHMALPGIFGTTAIPKPAPTRPATP